MLDGRVFAIAPLGPRAPIVAHTRIAGEPEREVPMGSAITALAVRNDLRIATQAQRFEFRAQLRGWLKAPVGGVALGPIAMDGAGNCAAAFGANAFAEIFLVTANVENLHLGPAQALDDVRIRRADFLARLALEARRLEYGRNVGKLLAGNRSQAAIEHPDPLMPHPFEQP